MSLTLFVCMILFIRIKIVLASPSLEKEEQQEVESVGLQLRCFFERNQRLFMRNIPIQNC